jgi:hypothetical protein
MAFIQTPPATERRGSTTDLRSSRSRKHVELPWLRRHDLTNERAGIHDREDQMPEVRSLGIAQQIQDLTIAVLRLAAAVEQLCSRLGVPSESRYTPPVPELIGEQEMASMLGVPRRTLAEHRKSGRLPGCWVKNGRRIFWLPEATKNAWREGVV